jgi:hypothetical protein
MGNRANVELVFNDNQSIFIYAHWEGSRMVNVLHDSLSKRARWTDDEYLARIITGDMINKLGYADETSGMGLSPSPVDGRIVARVLLEEQRLTDVELDEHGIWSGSFEEFVSRPRPENEG